jgi:hypothetical protein
VTHDSGMFGNAALAKRCNITAHIYASMSGRRQREWHPRCSPAGVLGAPPAVCGVWAGRGPRLWWCAGRGGCRGGAVPRAAADPAAAPRAAAARGRQWRVGSACAGEQGVHKIVTEHMFHACLVPVHVSHAADISLSLSTSLKACCQQAIQSMASADFRKGRDDAVAVTTILGALAKAERATLLGFPLREPAMLSAGAQADEVCRSRLHQPFLCTYNLSTPWQ